MIYRVKYLPANRAYRQFFLDQSGRLTRDQDKCQVFSSVDRARTAARKAVPAAYDYKIVISPV